MSKPGFTLLEILLALTIISLGVVALAESLTRLVRLGAVGRQRGRVAMVMASRLDRLRIEARRAACTAPPNGTASNPDGIQESWSATTVGAAIQVVIVARGSGSVKPDTLLVRFPCV